MSLTILPQSAPDAVEWVFERRLSSQLDLKEELIGEIVQVMGDQNWFTEDDRHWLLLCLDEAIVNAMIHGNEGDPQLFITVRLGLDDIANRWVIIVSDQGVGFSPQDVPDSNDPDSLLLEHGRGILLMNEWLDELTYYDNGSTIFMARSHVSPVEGKKDAG
jgi:serine/threonine-protein kinase RsbW